jgi:hypothetical protein
MLVWKTKDGTGPARPDNRRKARAKKIETAVRRESVIGKNFYTPESG